MNTIMNNPTEGNTSSSTNLLVVVLVIVALLIGALLVFYLVPSLQEADEETNSAGIEVELTGNDEN